MTAITISMLAFFALWAIGFYVAHKTRLEGAARTLTLIACFGVGTCGLAAAMSEVAARAAQAKDARNERVARICGDAANQSTDVKDLCEAIDEIIKKESSR